MLSLKNNLRELQMKLERYSKYSNTKSQSIQDSLLSQIEVVKNFIKNENNRLMVRPASAAALLVKNNNKLNNSIPYNGWIGNDLKNNLLFENAPIYFSNRVFNLVSFSGVNIVFNGLFIIIMIKPFINNYTR